jgi:PAS domain-containing protein
MHRFIEQQNIVHLERLLATEGISDKSRDLLEAQLLAAQRRLAMLNAVKAGLGSRPRSSSKLACRFRDEFEAAPMPLLLLDPGPGMRIVHANKAYAAATMVDLGRVAGEKLFNVFPDNPGDPFADGAANVFDSLRIVAETGRSHSMAVQRYDVRNQNGMFVEKYWRPVNSPVLDADDGLMFILNRVLDVTARFRASRSRAGGEQAPHASGVRRDDMDDVSA